MEYAAHAQSPAFDPKTGEVPALVVWHEEVRVLLMLDDADRRDSVTFPLTQSAAWNRLTQIQAGGKSFEQKAFIRLLKNEFMCSEAAVMVFRKINFKFIQQAEGEVSRGKESLGRNIEQQVKTGNADLPEEIVVEVPIYASAGEGRSYDVRLLLDYDAQAARSSWRSRPTASRIAATSTRRTSPSGWRPG